MLSFDHVRSRKKGQELVLLPLEGKLRERAIELARDVVAGARAAVGKPRDELEQTLESIRAAPNERRVLAGLIKLALDACEFEMSSAVEPIALRGEVFGLSAALRKNGEFARQRVLAEVAEKRGIAVEEVESALFADLRGAHRLRACTVPSAQELVSAYESGQVQAVLLRAVKVLADVRCKTPDAYRELFRKLKFRQLLHQISPLAAGGYRIEIDGPYSMFDSAAKYGLELALTLPALEACDELEIAAVVQLRDGGRPLTFRHRVSGRDGGRQSPQLRDDVKELLDALNAPGSGVRARVSQVILELPGLGLCVPDLTLEVEGSAEPVYIELLGFWSRDSVWKRVDLVERGLSERIVFAVSSRLRVSEEVLDGSESAALYVYRGRINARALLRSVQAVAQGLR